MFHIDWKFRGDHDRILLLLPPISNASSFNEITKHPYLVEQLRTTLHQIYANDTIQYIVAYIPFFNSNSFEDIELFEKIYNVELRILPSLQYLNHEEYAPYRSNECIYLIKNSDEWMNLSEPWDEYFDVCISEQLYNDYDAVSQYIKSDFTRDSEYTMGANYVYGSVYASLNMTKRIPFDGNMLRILSGMHQSCENEGDVVLILGNLGSHEVKYIYRIVEMYLQECRLGGVYVFGNTKNLLKPLMEQYPEISFHAYLQPIIEKENIEFLWSKLKRHGGRHNTFGFIGAFELEEDDYSYWEELEKPLLKACFYTPESWSTLHTNIIRDKLPCSFTYEPIGLLQYFIDGRFQVEEKEETPDYFDSNIDDNDNDNDNDNGKGVTPMS